MKYDIVFLTILSDLSYIKNLKKNGSKVVLEVVDSYLIKTNLVEDILRFLGKEYIHKNFFRMIFPKKFTSELKKAFKLVDAVICTTEEQKNIIQKFNSNVHIILDYMDEDIIEVNPNRSLKKNTLNILWEGLPSNLINFEEIAEVFNELGKEININLHLVTDLESNKYFTKFYKILSSDRIKKYKLKVNTYLYEWNFLSLSSLASVCDLAIIPLLQKNRFVLGKPENKLILLWKLGLPVLTSYSTAYSSTMKKADIDMVCMNKEEWKKSLRKFNNLDFKKRTSLSEKVKLYANKNYTKNKYIDNWHKLFLSII